MIAFDPGTSRPATRRIVPLAGGHNFRDLGGYPAQDGHSVRWGLVYRSAAMDGFGDADFAELAGRGVGVICDLRSTGERAAAPVTIPPSLDAHYWARDHESGQASLSALLLTPGVAAEDTAAWMHARYRRMPYEQAEAFAAVFGLLADTESPLVFNCAAGKDRTGAAAALLLTALVVPRAIVMQDYMLSALFTEAVAAKLMASGGIPSAAAGSADLLRPVNAVDPGYLHAMFEAIETQDGSMGVYLQRRLGVDGALLDRLRRRLLERVPAPVAA